MYNLAIKQSNDVSLISQMYLQLAEDEQADVQLSEHQAAKKIETFLKDGEIAFVFSDNGQAVGYALVMPDRQPVYLHHFYICRDARRCGIGTAAFHLMMQKLGVNTIDLDVFVWNERGKAFWQSLGFTPRATIMRYDSENVKE